MFQGSSRILPATTKAKLLALSLALVIQASTAIAQVGKIEPAIPCLEDQEQTYSLYRPTYYSSKIRMPVLILLDPRGQSQNAVEAFRDGAETFGWMVASPQGIAGPLDPNYATHPVMLVYEDLVRRFAVDIEAVYMGGLGSSATIALDLTRRLKTNAGLILCSPKDLDLGDSELLKQPTFLTAGNLDPAFNLIADDRKQPGSKNLFALAFSGVQQWPPQDISAAGLGWLLEKTTPSNSPTLSPDRLEKIYSNRIALADKLAASHQSGMAMRLWQSLNPDLFPAHTESINRALKQLENSQSMKQQQALLQEALDMETKTRTLFANAFKPNTNTSDPQFTDHLVWWKRQVGTLLDLATQDQRTEKQAAASRLLESVWQQSYVDGLTQLETRSYPAAIYHFLIACATFPDQAFAHYALGCAYAGNQQTDLALSALATSVEKGVRQSELFHQQPLFDGFRMDSRYQAILEQLKLP